MITVRLNEIASFSVDDAGGKALPLALLKREGINIPDGYIVFSSVFNELRLISNAEKIINDKLEKLRSGKMRNFDRISNELRKTIESIKIPKNIKEAILKEYDGLKVRYVAVRSSSASEDQEKHSWAGEFETYTYITRNNLIPSIIKCWSSLYTPRALTYAYKHKIPFASKMAVMVQKMIDSDLSGVCFTCDPGNSDEGTIFIEAIKGQGELLVHGDVTPDRYWVRKDTEVIVDVEINNQTKNLIGGERKAKIVRELNGEKQKMTGEAIVELSRVAKKIENIFRKPQDIEWAMADNSLFILQARPITGLINTQNRHDL